MPNDEVIDDGAAGAGDAAPVIAAAAGEPTDEQAFNEAAEADEAADKAKADAKKPDAKPDDDDDAPVKDDAAKPTAKPKAEKPAEDADDEEDPAFKKLAEVSGRKKKPDAAPAVKDDAKPPADDESPPAPKKDAPAPKKDDAHQKTKLRWKDPDTENDVEMDPEEWEKQFPDFAGYVQHKAEALARDAVKALRESGEIVDSTVVKDLQAQVVSMGFDMTVSRVHADWKEHAKPDSEFRTKWLERRPAEDKALFFNGGVSGAIALLDAYKAHKAAVAKRAAEGKSKQTAEHARTNDLHGNSLAGAGVRQAESQETVDAVTAFEREADALDARDRRSRR